MGLAKRTNVCITILVALFGLTCVLVLPGLPVGRAATTAAGASKKVLSSGLDSSRRVALEKLYAQYKSGAPFSEEEGIILQKFGEGVTLTDLEADVVISRALFDHYISNTQLTKEQQELLTQYSLSVARRSTDVADLKTRLLNRRIAAAAAAPPRTTPLVAPANDLCGGAEVIPAAGPFPYMTAVTADITDATTTGDPTLPSCQTNVSRSIWYTFTPSATARYTISTCVFDGTATTLEDPVMAIYTSAGVCTGPYTEVPTASTTDGCDDDMCVEASVQAIITTQLTGGTRYYIVVWQFDQPPPTAGSTAVQLKVSQVVPPVNDACAGAVALSLNTPVNGTTEVAANDYQLSGSGCFTGVGQTASTAAGGDVVYSFTAPSAGNYSFRVTNFDTTKNLVLYVASTCPAGAPPVTVGTCLAAANRLPSSTSEEVSCVALTNGQQVFIFVDESFNSTGSSFTIEVNTCVRETEPNDTPATATAFACSIEGAITPGTDVDFFSLGSPAAGSRVFAMIDGVAATSADFDLRVTTTTDTLEYDDFNNTAPFGVLAGNVAGTPLTGAPSFLRINQINSVASEPYRLYSIVQPPIASATAEIEPNNTTAQANSAANSYFTGSLAAPTPSTDVDIFAFSATAGDLIFLSLDCDPTRNATPIDGALALLDSAGTELVAASNADSSSSTTSGAGSLTAFTPFSPSEGLLWRARTTGTYYAKVIIGTGSAIPAGAGDYLLSISTNCLPAPAPPVANPGTVSFFCDFDMDGKSELGFYRSGLWGFLKSAQSYSLGSAQFFSWGGSMLQPIVADFDGDDKADIAYIVPPSGGQSAAYAILQSTKNYSFAAGDVLFFPAGFPVLGDSPVAADFDGDGKADPGIWRASQGVWIIPKSSTNYTDYIFSQWGQQGDLPVIADFDMDGKADIGFYRNGLWGVLKSAQNYSLGSAQFFSWGGAGLQPITGDFDGDNKADIGYIVPPSGGQSATYAILKSSTGYSFAPGDVLFSVAGFPVLGDTPVVDDFDGDGKDDPGIWRESQGVWIIPLSMSNYTTYLFSQWGQSGDIPFPNSTGKH